ncbi:MULTISPECIES: hypothetical protein [unclassified Bradyrhizobium]|uniref:hypothetical protein n=1 Tax=unclassified Bradyrhizobium TaxID=2631580 RepID=UPI002479081C|nr:MULTISPECIES: hypothetical protein [unclassified Bradyrhizobium]WGR68489.1 hypothetical protein MTX24_23980 [Bradyrhizobium sp. ISRA426]WGR80544.1 hypothetical protein MTX21_09095 [Bradyrhizobium sp. ISRA430]WGR83729.1 hypothetical protein MTX25_23660 [Bradyrhizobium sp. ISRA432]
MLKIRDALLDQDTVTLPFDQGLPEQVNQPFGLARVVAAGLKITDPLLLIADALRALLYILVGLDQKALLGMELLGTFGKGRGHGGASSFPFSDRRIERL